MSKGAFEVTANIAIRAFGVFANLGLMYRYGRAAMFYLPESWMAPFTPIFSWPLAPAGTIIPNSNNNNYCVGSVGLHWWLLCCRHCSKAIFG